MRRRSGMGVEAAGTAEAVGAGMAVEAGVGTEVDGEVDGAGEAVGVMASRCRRSIMRPSRIIIRRRIIHPGLLSASGVLSPQYGSYGYGSYGPQFHVSPPPANAQPGYGAPAGLDPNNCGPPDQPMPCARR